GRRLGGGGGVGAEGVEEVPERGRAVGGGDEADGPGLADALVPVVGQHQGRSLGQGVDVAGPRLLVVVGRVGARRAGGLPQGGRVPQGAVGVAPRRHLLGGQDQRALRGQAVGAEDNQLAYAHGGIKPARRTETSNPAILLGAFSTIDVVRGSHP